MRKLLCALIFLVSLPVLADNHPEATLQKYLDVLTGDAISGTGSLMDSTSMSQLKATMDEAITRQAEQGNYRLQHRIFGKRVDMQHIADTTADFYLNALGTEIRRAAESQGLTVTGHEIIGKVQETESRVHIIVRLFMLQGEREGKDILVYSLVREDSGWKMNFPATFKQMLAVIESSARQTR